MMVVASSGVEQIRPAGQRVGFLERLHAPGRPVLVFDGATGTSLQQMNLSAADFARDAGREALAQQLAQLAR